MQEVDAKEEEQEEGGRRWCGKVEKRKEGQGGESSKSRLVAGEDIVANTGDGGGEVEDGVRGVGGIETRSGSA